MENVSRSAFAGLLFVTGLYLMTGIVYDEGGFGVQLVMKPSLTLLVGGGEEGAWQREHPNQPKPWWLVGNFVSLVIDDWEGGHPWWEEVGAQKFKVATRRLCGGDRQSSRHSGDPLRSTGQDCD